MPTPSDPVVVGDTAPDSFLASPRSPAQLGIARLTPSRSPSSCPPDDRTANADNAAAAARTAAQPDEETRASGANGPVDSDLIRDDDDGGDAPREPTRPGLPTPPPEEANAGDRAGETAEEAGEARRGTKQMDAAEVRPIRDTPSPLSSVDETSECENARVAGTAHSSPVDEAAPSYGYGLVESPFPRHRFLPNSSSSFLQPGSRFIGSQQSDRQVYEVQVEIKHVDMAESFLCGYLRIQGLTEDHATLTTYFEGEIIGTKYTFQTRHPEWGSNERTDMQHWGRFPAWRPLAKQAKRQDFNYKNFLQRENIFMRWKEHFLVPDHKVRAISGASFEGFYYICFNQVSGDVSGIYFHARSEKFQQLELKHVPDYGCTGALEFR